MRKIQTAQDRERKRKRNNIILAVIMASLIGLSTIGYALMGRDDQSSETLEVNYGGLKFIQSGDYWTTQINGKTFYFANLPTELNNISIEGNYSFIDYQQKPVYIVNLNPAVNGMVSALQGVILRVQEACLEGYECSSLDLPIKSCEDNVIIYENTKTESKVVQQKNCVFIEGDSFKGTDKLIYRMLNIA